MTTNELAAYTGVRPRTIQRWRLRDGMPSKPSRVEFLRWAAPRRFVWDQVTEADCLDEMGVYRDAAMFRIRLRGAA